MNKPLTPNTVEEEIFRILDKNSSIVTDALGQQVIKELKQLLDQKVKESINDSIDQLTKNWNNYIGDMPQKEKDKLGYLELTGMLWGTAMTTKEQLINQLTNKEEA